MNWFTKLIRKKTISEDDLNFFDGYQAYSEGKKIWEATLEYDISQFDEKIKKQMVAVTFFDKAIDLGFKEEPNIFSMRGSTLYYSGFYFEALEDFNKAILANPKYGTASNYYYRSLVKYALLDYEGSLSDVKEAIRLSKLNTDENIYLNKFYLKAYNFNSAASYFEFTALDDVTRALEFEKKHPTDKNIELKGIKRRAEQTTVNLDESKVADEKKGSR